MSSCSTYAQYKNATDTLSSGYLDNDENISHSTYVESTSFPSFAWIEGLDRSRHQAAPDTVYFALANFLSDSRSLVRKTLSVQGYTLEALTTPLIQRDIIPVDISPLKEIYKSPDWHLISHFIQQNPYLLRFLESVSSQILAYPGVGHLHLEYFSDSSENWEKIYLICQTDIDDPDKICSLEDEIFTKCFDPLFDLYKGKVVLSLV